MKRLPILQAILAVSAVSLYLAQRSKRHDAISPDAVLDAAAEIQRDISRAPMHLTRLSDEREIRIGDELAEEYLSAAPAHSAEMESVEKYLGKVGDRLANHAHRQVPYRFHLIVDANLINAFALPEGHMFVGFAPQPGLFWPRRFWKNGTARAATHYAARRCVNEQAPTASRHDERNRRVSISSVGWRIGIDSKNLLLPALLMRMELQTQPVYPLHLCQWDSQDAATARYFGTDRHRGGDHSRRERCVVERVVGDIGNILNHLGVDRVRHRRVFRLQLCGGGCYLNYLIG
jgi:hypothetical protein